MACVENKNINGKYGLIVTSDGDKQGLLEFFIYIFFHYFLYYLSFIDPWAGDHTAAVL